MNGCRVAAAEGAGYNAVAVSNRTQDGPLAKVPVFLLLGWFRVTEAVCCITLGYCSMHRTNFPPSSPQSHSPDDVPVTPKGGDSGELLRQILDLLVEVRDLLVHQRQVRDHYSTDEAARILGKADWTVREWCRLGRVNAEKRRSGRGRAQEWVIPHAELLRIQKEGLLPLRKN